MASDFGSALGTSGSPVEVTLHNGKVIKLRHFNQSDKTALEQRVKARARAELMANKDELEDSEFRLAHQGYLSSCASGIYQFGGEVCSTYTKTPEGVALIISRLSGLSEAEAMDAFTNDVDGQLLAACKQIFEESFAKKPTTKTTDGTGTNPVSVT